MPLLLTEADVRAILTMPMALEDVEISFRRLGEGRSLASAAEAAHSRENNFELHGGSGYGRRLPRPKDLLDLARQGAIHSPPFSRGNGRDGGADRSGLPRADAHGSGQRSGGKSEARDDARTVGIIGTGLQARTQLEAVTAARKIERIRAFVATPNSARNPPKR